MIVFEKVKYNAYTEIERTCGHYYPMKQFLKINIKEHRTIQNDVFWGEKFKWICIWSSNINDIPLMSKD